MSETKWKRPDELLRIQHLKNKQKALQARLQGVSLPTAEKNAITTPGNDRAIIGTAKRRNPFAKQNGRQSKEVKLDASNNSVPQIEAEDTLFELLNNQKMIGVNTPQNIPSFLPQNFQQLQPEPIHIAEKASSFLPIDWSLKNKLRILSSAPIVGTSLKTSQEASGLTSFVRCVDLPTSSTGLDISPGARFHQSTLYWQHPNIPWLTLFPRNAKNNDSAVQLGESERVVLAKDWADSFRSLFQLIRARQCPFFYLCGNSFTALFRAAGIGGRVETHVFLTPTSRGMRAALRQEEIEFSMPLKRLANETQNRSFDATQTGDETVTTFAADNGSELDEDDDEDNDAWLASLGVDADQIKRINSADATKKQLSDCKEDFSESSAILMEGVESQAFFNFLLNAKSTTAKVGRLAGVPPTLLSPVAFQGATLRPVSMRTTKIRSDNKDYFSTELRGPILPHVVPLLGKLVAEKCDSFILTTSHLSGTLALGRATQRLMQDATEKHCKQVTADWVFGRENLSDCGLSSEIVESLCRISEHSVITAERICYSQENGGYLWS